MPSAQRPPNRLLQALPKADYEALLPHLEVAVLVRDAVLVEAGDALSRVYLPHAGAVSMVVNLSEGQTVEVAMIGRDGVVGATTALVDGISLSDVVVLFPGTASTLDTALFRAAAERSAALRNLLARHEQALIAQAVQSAACNASHSVEARLSRWLLRARELHDGETLPLTQELLAQMIGVQRNAVSIVAHALQQAGIIRYSRGQIEITDVEALQRTACECYRSIRAKHEQLLKMPN